VEEKLARRNRTASPASKYPGDPCGYCKHVLKVVLTKEQEQVLNSLLVYPYRVLCNSGHSIGKTFVAACASSWWYDTYDPGVVITTAPTERDVIDLLWTEIRLLRGRAGLPDTFVGARAPEMRTSEEHYAKGYTARKGESFQGRHRPHMLFVFDEMDGVESQYWVASQTMFKPELGHAWLCIGNPVSTVSAAALEEIATDPSGRPKWHIMNLSALDHPNIAKQLRGEQPDYPHAVTLPQVEQWLMDWCEVVPEPESTDILWPPKTAEIADLSERRWYRPGPIAEARMLGRRPAAGTFGVWSQRLFESCLTTREFIDLTVKPEIGCDVARFGDDWTAICVRWGPLALTHEAWNGWPPPKTAGRLKYWCRYAAEFFNRMRPPTAEPVLPTQIRCKIDDTGVGGGVTDLADCHAFVGVSSASKALDQEGYPNKRSELWFATAERAREGNLDLSRLSRDVIIRLRQQALAPQWSMDAQGRRVVEPKQDTKDRIGRSPDDMDALNLAFYDGGGFLAPTAVIENEQRSVQERMRDPGRRASEVFGRRARDGW
jgi:hypothetical protein